MRRLPIWIGMGCLWGVSVWAQDRAEPRCAPDAGILESSQRASLELSVQIAEAETGGVKLEGALAGVTIDASCFKADAKGNPPLELRAFRRRRIEAALLHMLDRFTTCDTFLKIPDFTQAKALLKNTQILCATDAKDAAIGQADISVKLPDGSKHAAGSSAEAPLRLTLNAVFDSPENRLDTGSLNLEGPNYPWSVDNLASILGHELLHGTSNATVWHTLTNRAKDYDHQGCTNSTYSDRIYAISAICFPHSENGLDYFDAKTGAAHCPAVCEKALGSVDPTLTDSLRVDAGQSLVAQALSPTEATNRCAKVQKLSQYVKDRTAALAATRQKINTLRSAWTEQEPPQSEWPTLTRRASFLLDWIHRLKEGYEKAPEARAVLKKERNIWKLARSPDAPELIQILDEIEKWVDSPPPEGFDLFARSLKSPKNPKLP